MSESQRNALLLSHEPDAEQPSSESYSVERFHSHELDAGQSYSARDLDEVSDTTDLQLALKPDDEEDSTSHVLLEYLHAELLQPDEVDTEGDAAPLAVDGGLNATLAKTLLTQTEFETISAVTMSPNQFREALQDGEEPTEDGFQEDVSTAVTPALLQVAAQEDMRDFVNSEVILGLLPSALLAPSWSYSNCFRLRRPPSKKTIDSIYEFASTVEYLQIEGRHSSVMRDLAIRVKLEQCFLPELKQLLFNESGELTGHPFPDFPMPKLHELSITFAPSEVEASVASLLESLRENMPLVQELHISASASLCDYIETTWAATWKARLIPPSCTLELNEYVVPDPAGAPDEEGDEGPLSAHGSSDQSDSDEDEPRDGRQHERRAAQAVTETRKIAGLPKRRSDTLPQKTAPLDPSTDIHSVRSLTEAMSTINVRDDSETDIGLQEVEERAEQPPRLS